MPNNEAHSYPEGVDFIGFAKSHQDRCERKTESFLPDVGDDVAATLSRLGTVLSLLNRMSTCHWGCHGREHVFEYLAGRAVSLALAALRLINYGHYDEAFSLVRSIAELGNLMQLFMTDIDYFTRWRDLPERERINKFSPGAVRKALDENDTVVPTSREKYSMLCEVGVHVTPSTIPQAHNPQQVPTLGGYYQETGLKTCINELAWTTATVSGPLAKLAVLERDKAERIVEASIEIVETIGDSWLDN